MFSDVFSNLLQDRNISSYKLTKDTGLSNGMISDWRSGKNIPSADNLVKLADYFGVSVDYLLGRDDVPNRKEIISPLTGDNMPE